MLRQKNGANWTTDRADGNIDSDIEAKALALIVLHRFADYGCPN